MLVIPEVFAITNQGEDDIEFSIEYRARGESSPKSTTLTSWSEGIYFELADEESGTLPPGQSTIVDAAVVEQNGNSVSGGTLTINADRL